jgi:phenylpropionate dioxygenase-like ring-hydroxylating dioxygenase large terminal subunit
VTTRFEDGFITDPVWTPDPGSDHIDRRIYTSRAIFEAEQERIFSRTWQFAGAASELRRPGDFLTVDVGQDPVIVVRDQAGELNAFYNACTHRGANLADEPRGNCGLSLTCPYHQWRFALDGSLKGVPYRAAYGKDFPADKLGLVPAHAEQCGGLVFVATRPNAPTLRDFLGEAWPWVEQLSADREVIGRAAWTYEGNWKLWHENFRDNYHPEFVHRLVRDLENGYADAGENRWLDPGHSMLEWRMVEPDFERYVREMKAVSGIDVDPSGNEEWRMGFGATKDGSKDAGAPDQVMELPQINIAAIFPNLDLQHAVGGLTVQVLTPLEVDLSRIDITFMAPVGEPPELRQFRLDHDATTQGSWGKVSADDTEVCERTQSGLRGRATAYSNMARGRRPGAVGETRDEYSMRSLYHTWRRYMYGGQSGR